MNVLDPLTLDETMCSTSACDGTCQSAPKLKKKTLTDLYLTIVLLLFRVQHPKAPPSHCQVCVRVCLQRVCVRQCQHCCSEQKSCQEVKEVESGSKLCPAKTDKPQQRSCQGASFGTAVSQHTSPEPDMGHYCRSAWASMIWTAAVWQGSASMFVAWQPKCGKSRFIFVTIDQIRLHIQYI